LAVESVSIRPLGPDDAKAYFALRLHGLQDTPYAFGSSYADEVGMAEDEILRRVTPSIRKCIFGAFADGNLVGIVGILQEEGSNQRHKGFIHGMFVVAEFRKAGVGRRLMQAALDFGFGIPEIRQINLGVAEMNTPARRLYESLGFVPFGFERACIVIDGVDIDEFMMAKHRPAARRS
jgi:RimJ/RimL family protein N-acetyltransferase